MRYFTTHFPIHCHIHQRETKLKFVRKKENTAHRVRERESKGKRRRETKELRGEQEKEERIFVRVGTQ